MNNEIVKNALRIKNNIQNSNKTIYDNISPSDTNLWLPDLELEWLLRQSLIGNSYFGQQPRTRSKSIGIDIIKALGYPVPVSLKRINPRFPGQNFDKYAQQSTNLQIWNEAISPTRRYCLVILDKNNNVINVKVLSGTTLQNFDTTGKLTTKYQANIKVEYKDRSLLLSKFDTNNIINSFHKYKTITSKSPAQYPRMNELMPIKQVYEKLNLLIGQELDITEDSRKDGDILQNIVYKCLGYNKYEENGQLPDLMNQLLEIKKQTSHTIDLGLFKPNDRQKLQIPAINGYVPAIEDIRYAIFYCSKNNYTMTIKSICLVTGRDFFNYFHLFGGKTQNKKIQIHLPKALWKLDD